MPLPSRARSAARSTTITAAGALVALLAATVLALIPAGAASASVPNAPTNVVATPTTGQVSLKWSAPFYTNGTITGYVVTPYVNGVARTSTTYPASPTTQVIGGLTNGTSYTFTVKALNASGPSIASAPSAPVTVGAPSPPAFPTTSSGDSQVSIWWWASAPNASAVTGYVVTPSVGGVAQAPITFSGPGTNRVVTGLTNGTTYTFSVRGVNASGTGLPSTTAPVVAGTPGAPGAPTATPGNGQATVTWPAAAANGSAITGYTVTPFIGSTAQTPRTFNSAATTQVVNGLTNGTAYTFAVTATNARGTGSRGSLGRPVTVGVPSAPSSPSAVPSSGKAMVSWTPPATSNGSAITGYEVTPFASGVAQPVRTFSGTATTQPVTGLADGSSYTFTVAATNANGTGAGSNASAPVTVGETGTVPAAPAAPMASPSSSSAVVSWTAPADGGSAITGYVVTPWNGSTALPARQFDASATRRTITGLTNGQNLVFTVQAVNGIGTGPASPFSAPVVVGSPNAPTTVLATATTGRVVLKWSAPFFSNGAITGYVVTPIVDGVAQSPITYNSTATTQTLTGLSNGSSYSFEVRARNASGVGVPSIPSLPVVVGAPSAPAFPTVVAGNGQVNVWWWGSAPNASPVTGYVVTPYVDGVAQAPQTFTGSGTNRWVTGLVNGTTYTFTVAGINAFGTGPTSTTAPITVGVPGAPGPASATTGDGAATVSWAPAAPNGAAVTGYTVTPYIGSTAQPARTFPSAATTQVVTGLTNGKTYSFTVTATNARGTGPRSASGPTVTVGVPGVPAAPTGVPGSGSATVSWSAPALTNGAAVTGFVVTPYLDGVAQPARTFASADTTQTVTGLTDGRSYTFTVAATNARGTGLPSAGGAPVLVGSPAVTAVPTAKPGVGSATVSWTAPADNGSAITGYQITPFVDGRPLAPVAFTGSSTSRKVTGLVDGRSYAFTVSATNARGAGLPSAPSPAVVPGGVPGAPATPSATTSHGLVTVGWAAPADHGSPITGYVITPNLGGTQLPAIPVAAGVTSLPLPDLGVGAPVTVTVAATNANGTGAPSIPSIPVVVGAPDAPLAPSVGAGSTQLPVSWTAPDDGGSPITGYVVTPWIGSAAQPSVTVDGSTTSTVLTGLADGTTYRVTVAATNANGTGVASPLSAPVAAGAPGMPGGVVASVSGTDVSLSWTRPATNGTSLDAYIVTPWIGDTPQAPLVLGTWVTNRVLPGLNRTGVTYRFTVAARSSAGVGPASPLSNAVTAGHWFCLPAPPSSSADIRTALNHHDRLWQGGDGASPVVLPDGRVLWLFGDTIVGTVQPDGSLTSGWSMTHGSALIQDGACFDPFYSSTTTALTSLIPNPSVGFYWAGDSWVSPDGSQLNVLVSHAKALTGGGLQSLDSGVAVFRLPDLAFVRVDKLPPPPKTGLPYWRGLAHRDADGYVYLSNVNSFDHYAVRFKATTTSFSTLTDWEYWTPDGWSLVPDDAQPMSVSPSTYAGLSIEPTGTGYVATAQGLGADTGFATGWWSATPTGPWTPLGQLVATPSAGGNSSTYGVHPVTVPGVGQLIIWSVSPSASGNTTGAGIGVADLPRL